MPELTTTNKRQDSNGVVRLNEAEFRDFFDAQARKNLRLSGRAALKRIRGGKAGSSLAWTELVLLSTLLPEE